ncbi:MAG: ABC transporter permease [Rhodospirillales bacterium]|nr:ABC transporter permease [Rhodospirillales bacterium]
MDLLLDIAFKHLRNRRRQTLVSLLGVSLGVGFFIAIAAMMQGFQNYFIDKIIDVSPHVEMKDEYRAPPPQPAERAFAGGAVHLVGVKPKDEPRGIKNGKAKVAALSALPGVTVAPVLSGEMILRYGSKDVSGTIVGIDPARERLVSKLERDLTAGGLDDLYTTANGIILGSGLAAKVGAALGDTLTVLSTAGVILKMKVVGLFETGIVNLDNFQAYALLKKVQVLQDRPNVVNRIRLRLERVTEAEVVARRVEARFGYRTESWQEANKNVLGIFVIQNGIMYSTTGAILVVAAFGIFNIISTVVLEKSRDIAILKSLGLTARDIGAIFVFEGLLIGVIGTLLGWAIGYGLTQALESIEFEIEGFVKSEGFILYYSATHYLIGAVMALIASTFAAYLPARKAARVDPVDIIRGAT